MFLQGMKDFLRNSLHVVNLVKGDCYSLVHATEGRRLTCNGLSFEASQRFLQSAMITLEASTESAVAERQVHPGYGKGDVLVTQEPTARI